MDKIKKSYIYVFTAIFSTALLCIILRIWNLDIFAPFNYGGDSAFLQEMLKGIIEHGWFLENSRLGAPLGSNLYGYPMVDFFNFFVLKILGMVTGSWVLAFNLFFLGVFPAITLTSLHVFLKYKVDAKIAVVCALVYTYLPYHFFRGTGHLLLSAYYMVPLLCWLALSMFEKNGYLFRTEIVSWKNLDKKTLLWVLLIAAVAASTGVYYAFFGILLIFFAGVFASINQKSKVNLISALIITAAIGSVSMLNVLPNLIYRAAHPESAHVVRAPGESEMYGLKLAQLLLPRTGHNSSRLAGVKNTYNASAPLVNENDWSTLGVLASLGFLFSLLALILDRFRLSDIYKRIGVLNFFSVLVATTGGFAVFIALFVTSSIRAYNRISVFIAFLSLLTVAFLLNNFYEKYIKTRNQKIFFYLGLLGLLLAALYDQAPMHAGSNICWRDVMNSDAKFFSSLETQLGEHAMVFQLPYMPFPEAPPVNKLTDYEHFRGYLNSKSLRWSYGAFKGTDADAFIKYLSLQTGAVFIEDLITAGYTGLYIDRFGYADSAAALEKNIEGVLKEKPFVSENGRFAFYNLGKYKNRSFNSKKQVLR
jgi:phosphoglycerol transferase